MARRDPKVRDTKARILDAALHLFGERGYGAVSPEDVAERAGVTKGAFYYYFRDKDDLGRDVQHSLWERLKSDALAAFDPAVDTLTNLERCFGAYLTALQGLEEARFFLRDSWGVPALDAAGRSDQLASVALVRGLLDEGVRRGDVAPVNTDALAHVLVGAYSEATLHVLTTGESGPTIEVVRRLAGAFATRRAPGRPPDAKKAARRPATASGRRST